MTENGPDTEPRHSSLSGKTTLLVCVLTLLAAAGITAVIFSTEPTAQRETATRKSAMLVNVVEVQRGTYRPTVVETGTVRPAREIQLSPQVAGQIVEVHPQFVPGGFIDRGETVVQIEPEDYENLLRQRESELMQAKTDLQLELGRQEIARQDFQLFEAIVSTNDASLVLRKPQLAAAKIRVDAAQAAVDQAKLDLERTTIECPFDAQILTRSVNLGSQVSSGTSIARILGIDTYWVMASVPLSKIPFLQFPRQDDGSGAPVELRNRSTWPKGVTRTGNLFKLVGSLDATTRLARVLIEVDDPLARLPESEGLPSLLVDEFLEVRIEGKPIRNVVRLSRAYVRSNDTAWVMDADNRLQIRELDIVFKDAEHAYVREGLNDGDQVVTTHLSTVTDGAALRREGTEPAGESEPTDSE